MKIFITILLTCVTLIAYGKKSDVFSYLYSVNHCWAEQNDIANLRYPQHTNLTDRQWIKAHLQLVEQTLRARPTVHLTKQQKANRLKALDALNSYWHSGSFPINDEYNYRTPIFIDKYDNFCAVGYLVKATGYERVSRRIAAQTNLAYVREMNYPELNQWANDYGFTVDELAWIQPGYPPETYLQNIGKGTDGNVLDLFADDSGGKLYVGGDFKFVDSILPANNIAYVTEENGVYTWHAMGGGVNGPVHSILVSGNNVYVGGSFTMAGGKSVNNIAYWDGSSWSELGCIDGVVKDMVWFRDELYVAGDFSLCDSVSEINFASWSGNKWKPYNSGHALGTLDGRINTMHTDGSIEITLGGKFSYNGDPVNIIDFNHYSGFIKYSNSITNEVNDIEYHEYTGERYAVTTGDTDSTKLVWKLGSNSYWGAIYQFAFSAIKQHEVKTICSRGDDILVGGDIQFSSQIQPGPKGFNCGMIYQNQLVTYDGVWVDSTINKMVMFKGNLIVGGDFNTGYTGDKYGALHSIGRWKDPVTVPAVEKQQNEFTIYPNPARGSITVTNNFNANYFKLTDLSGRVVVTDKIQGSNTSIDLPELVPGIYMVELSGADGQKATQKLVIE